MRLNLGCGLNAPPGWINIDYSFGQLFSEHPRLRHFLRRIGLLTTEHMVSWPPNVVRHNLVKGLPFPERSATAIYSSHTLEHLYLDDAVRLLRECLRVLESGAYLRLALPDAEEFAARLLSGEGGEAKNPGLAFNESLNAHPLVSPSWQQRIRSLVGAPPHRWQPTRDLLSELLADVGFCDVTFPPFREGEFPDLERIEHRKQSFFVQARKPA